MLRVLRLVIIDPYLLPNTNKELIYTLSIGNYDCMIEHFANCLFSLIGWQDVLLIQRREEEGQMLFCPR